MFLLPPRLMRAFHDRRLSMKFFYLQCLTFVFLILGESIAIARPPKKCPPNQASGAIQEIFGECSFCKSKLAQFKKDIRWLNNRLRNIEKLELPDALKIINQQIEEIQHERQQQRHKTRIARSKSSTNTALITLAEAAVNPSQGSESDNNQKNHVELKFNFTKDHLYICLILGLLTWLFWRGLLIKELTEKNLKLEYEKELVVRDYGHSCALHLKNFDQQTALHNLEMRNLRNEQKVAQSKTCPAINGCLIVKIVKNETPDQSTKNMSEEKAETTTTPTIDNQPVATPTDEKESATTSTETTVPTSTAS